MIVFSIIIPVYNRADLLMETIETVLSQTYPHFEVIIVDDGSTDNVKQVINETYGHEERIKYFYKQNEERGAARNFGLKHAKGDYAVFFDSDDFMKPNYLEVLESVIAAKPHVKLLAAKYNYKNSGKIETHPLLKDLAEGWYDHHLFLKGNILACNYCIKIKDHDYKLFPPERELALAEDWLFLLANLGQNKIFIKDEVCLTMREHDGRSMNSNQKAIEARRKAIDWISKHLSFSEEETKTISAWSHYFCGIHEYLDHKRTASFKQALRAIKTGGLQKDFLMLFAKAIVGRRLIKAIR